MRFSETTQGFVTWSRHAGNSASATPAGGSWGLVIPAAQLARTMEFVKGSAFRRCL